MPVGGQEGAKLASPYGKKLSNSPVRINTSRPTNLNDLGQHNAPQYQDDDQMQYQQPYEIPENEQSPHYEDQPYDDQPDSPVGDEQEPSRGSKPLTREQSPNGDNVNEDPEDLVD